MPTEAFEANFDGLVGPTHNYAGLAWGNLASQKNKNLASSPRKAALEGLAKMKFLHDLGIKQAVLPPAPRPDIRTLRRLGFSGTDADVLSAANKQSPRFLAACYSASSMWAANAATVSPSADSADEKVHFTPANLRSQFHRSIETEFTARMLKQIFKNENHFAHHDPLPSTDWFGDEGAANHTRLATGYHNPGIQIFAFGRSAIGDDSSTRFPARQTREASEAIARLHQLKPKSVVFIRQNPAAIDAGAFHNDVVAVGNENVLLCHACAYGEDPLEQIFQSFAPPSQEPLHIISASDDELSLADSVSTYLFNSQLVTLPDGKMSLIAPEDCRHHAGVQRFLQRVVSEPNPIQSVHYIDVRQSMQNGGGPACLRLRVVLTPDQWNQVHPSVKFSPDLYNQLVDWVNRHYRDTLSPDDLADPLLLKESRDALHELSRILSLDPIYAGF